jgi:hypothetical protein
MAFSRNSLSSSYQHIFSLSSKRSWRDAPSRFTWTKRSPPLKLPPRAYCKEQFCRLPSLHSTFPICRTPLTHNWRYMPMTLPFLHRRTDTIVNRVTHATSILLRYFTKWKFWVNIHKTEAILSTRCRPVAPAPFHFQHTVILWNTHVRYLGLVLDSKLLFTRHITSVIHRASGTLLQLFPLLARDSTLTLTNKLTLYKLFIRSMLTYAAPIWSITSSYNYRYLQVSQSKCLCVIGNYPRRTPIPCLHATLNIPPIWDFIYHLTKKFFSRCPAHPNPLVSSIGNYTLADLHHQYKKYIHKRPKRILL